MREEILRRSHYPGGSCAENSMQSFLLIVLAFLTSAFNAVVGIGGGILLIAVLTTLLPASAIVPIHGVVQLASNASRNLFSIRHTDWSIMPAFLAGAAVGLMVGARAVLYFPVQYLPLILGLFILLVTWMPDFLMRRLLRGNFLVLGFLQGSLTLLVGATGPLNIPFLLRKKLDRNSVIATHGFLMTLIHLAKIVTYGLLGFSFTRYIPLIGGMVVAVIAGSYFGTKYRSRVPERSAHLLLKVLVTALSFGMIAKVLI